MSVPTRQVGVFREALRRGARLTFVQRTTLTRVAGHDGPMTAAELADEVGVHPSTARDTLETLRSARLVDRVRMPVRGRGRPSWGYRPRTPTRSDTPVRMLAEAAAATAAELRATHPDPEAAAHGIGVRWARYLVGDQTVSTAGSGAAAQPGADAEEPFTLADDMGTFAFFCSSLGFASTVPKSEPTSIAMHSCPFLLDGAVEPLVCRMHLGLLTTTITLATGGRVETTLLPWATPQTCISRFAVAAVAT